MQQVLFWLSIVALSPLILGICFVIFYIVILLLIVLFYLIASIILFLAELFRSAISIIHNRLS